MKKQYADQLISQYQNKIFGFALEKMRSISSAEELASDIICEVYSSFLRSKEIKNPDGYVYRIARNVYAKHIRNLKTNAVCMDISELILPFYDSGFEKSEHYDDLQRLRKEIGYLSERQRKIIYMHYYEDKSVAEIGKLLHISAGTVKWHLSDARSSLKEELIMEKYNDDLALNPITFCSMSHNGSVGSKGDTADMFDTRLKQNIAWSCYFTPLTVEEIARKLNVPCTYIADEVNILYEYGYLDRPDNGKNPRYRTNMYITDRRTFKTSERDRFKAAAQKYCAEFYEKVFADFDNSNDNWGLFCDGNDKNFMKYTLVMLCTLLMANQNSPDRFESYRVKRPDGGNFIAHACITDHDNEETEENPYWACGYMTRASDSYQSIQLDCRFSSRSKLLWQDNLNSDWQSLYDFIKGGCDKSALPPENYKRLCDKGYIFHDKVQVLSTHTPLSKLIEKRVSFPESLVEYAEEFDRQQYKEQCQYYPEHIRPLAKLYCTDCLNESLFVPYLIETMLEKGILKPLADLQKKSVFSIFVYE